MRGTELGAWARAVLCVVATSGCGGPAASAEDAPAETAGGDVSGDEATSGRGEEADPGGDDALRTELVAVAVEHRRRLEDAIEREDFDAFAAAVGGSAPATDEERRQALAIGRMMLRMVPPPDALEIVRVVQDGDLAGYLGYRVAEGELEVSLLRFQRRDGRWQIPRERGLPHHYSASAPRDERPVLEQLEEMVAARPRFSLRPPAEP